MNQDKEVTDYHHELYHHHSPDGVAHRLSHTWCVGQSARHAIWWVVKIQVMMKATDGGRNV